MSKITKNSYVTPSKEDLKNINCANRDHISNGAGAETMTIETESGLMVSFDHSDGVFENVDISLPIRIFSNNADGKVFAIAKDPAFVYVLDGSPFEMSDIVMEKFIHSYIRWERTSILGILQHDLIDGMNAKVAIGKFAKTQRGAELILKVMDAVEKDISPSKEKDNPESDSIPDGVGENITDREARDILEDISPGRKWDRKPTPFGTLHLVEVEWGDEPLIISQGSDDKYCYVTITTKAADSGIHKGHVKGIISRKFPYGTSRNVAAVLTLRAIPLQDKEV